MQRLRSSRTVLSRSQAITQLRKKAFRSWAAVQDTYFSTKDIFESHKVVFTVGTSIASVATAWFGYTLRHVHVSRVDQRLESIEKAMKNNHNLEQSEIRNIMDSGTIGLPSCIATAGTTLVIGTSKGDLYQETITKSMKMLANKILSCIVVVILVCESVVGTRTKLFAANKVQDAASALAPSPSDDGICATMVATQGYACEEHTVTTQDGYILSMQRIPAGKSGEASGNGVPVLLQHGLLMDGITWLLLPPGQSLAFLLADNGYEVWIGNTRGTKYSLGHTSLSPDDRAYWEWSWDELVAYDLPATFQYVRDQTGQKIHYVGHSLGTLVAFAAFSKDMQLKNLRSAALLSPIAYLGQMPSPLARTAADNYVAEVQQILQYMRARPGSGCSNYLTASTGFLIHTFNMNFFCNPYIGPNCCLSSASKATLFKNFPQSTATKNMIHLSQMVRMGTLEMYDYGLEDANMEHYKQPTPPVYNMANIPKDVPLFLSYGGRDAISDVNDVGLLLDNLKDHDKDKLVVEYREDYAHLDFIMSVNANQLVYNPMLAFFNLH
ncbi:unnamed protein product [Malus baccata var. baccata]